MDGIRRGLLADRAVALDELGRSLLLQLPADLIAGAGALLERWRRGRGGRRIEVAPMSEGWLRQLEVTRGKRRDA
jgi:hypothetical protein